MDAPDAARRVREGAREARDRLAKALKTPRGERRLRLRSDDDPLLGNLMSGNPGAGTVGRAFTTLHDQVVSELDKSEDHFGRTSGLVSAVLDNSVVIHANCRASFDPFVVFSTLNATGLPLTATQILRARNLGLVQRDPERVKSATIQAWDNIERLDEGGDRFLQAFLVLRTGERIQSKDIVRRFDRDILKTRDLPREAVEREDHFLTLAREMQALSLPYAALADARWPLAVPPTDLWHENRVKLIIKNLGIRQLLPLLLASAAKRPSDFQDIVGSLERAAFVALVCLDNQTRWGDKTFELARDVYLHSADPSDIRKAVWAFFKEQLTDPREALRRRLPDQLFYGGRRKTQIRYFLTTMNDWGFPFVAPAEQPDIQAVWTLSDIHVDHIAPRQGASDIPPAERDRLGNLTPLKGRDNSSLSNKPFAQKRSKYAHSPLHITQELGKLTDWGIAELDQREEAMVNFATALFCQDIPQEES
jgi:hypothetical protein